MLLNTIEDMRCIVQALRQELHHTWAWLATPGLFFAIALTLLLTLLAYQPPSSYLLAIGGDQAAHLRQYDAPFLVGFHAAEPAPKDQEWWAAQERPYRWSMPDADIRLPAIGGQYWQLVLTLASGRPDNSSALAQIESGIGIPQTITVLPGIRRYRVLAATPAGDLRVRLRSAAFVAPNDVRELGIVTYALAASPLTAPFQLPASGQLLAHALIVGLIYGTGWRLGLRQRGAVLLGLAVGLIAAGSLAYDRLGLTVATPGLLVITVSCWLLAPILLAFLDVVLRWLAIRASPAERGALIGVVLAAWVARMVGVIHPYAQFSDLRFNANNLMRVIRGDIFLVAGLPCDAGAGNAPYPPAQYLTLAPLQLLIGDAGRSANEQLAQLSYLILGSVALFESIGAAIIWLLLRRLRFGRKAALLAAALYILPVPLLRAYSVGEMANLFGQALVPLLFLLLTLWPPAAHRGRAAILAASLTLGLMLSHTGVTISAACLVLGWLLLQLVRRERMHLLAFGIAVSASGLVALALFYSAYVHLPSQNQAVRAELAGRTPALICPAGRPFGEKLLATLDVGFGAGGTLSTPLVIAAAATVAGVRKKPQLHALLVAAVLGTLISFATLLNTDQPVRWAHFLFPALCLGGGVSLAVWAQRGRAGMALMLTLLVTILWFGASDWFHQISRYLH